MKVFSAFLSNAKKNQAQGGLIPLDGISKRKIFEDMERIRLHSYSGYLHLSKLQQDYDSLMGLSLQAAANEKLMRKQLMHVNAAEKRILEERIAREDATARRLFVKANAISIEMAKLSSKTEALTQDLSSKQSAYASFGAKTNDGGYALWKIKTA